MSTPLHNSAMTKPTYKSVQYKEIYEGEDGDESRSSEVSSYRSLQYRVYPWRWFMLVSMCFLNISNGMVC